MGMLLAVATVLPAFSISGAGFLSEQQQRGIREKVMEVRPGDSGASGPIQVMIQRIQQSVLVFLYQANR